jgi:DNA polymerase-1
MRAPAVAELVRTAIKAGARVYLRGARTMVEDVGKVPAEVMAALRSRRDELWAFMGGPELDRPPLELMASRFPGIQIVVPRDENEAQAVIARIEAEADVHAVPDQAQGHLREGRGLIGFDIETQANPGEQIYQSVTVNKEGKVHREPTLDSERVRRKGKPKSSAALDPRRSTIRLAQLYGGGSTCMVLDTRLVPLTALAPLLGRRKLVIHNATFELAFLHHAGLIDLDTVQFECTMQAAGLMLGVRRRSLDDACPPYLRVQVPKGLQTSDWSASVLSRGQIAYAALDAILALKLWSILHGEIGKSGRGEAYWIQRAAIPPAVKMEARGFLFDKRAHQAIQDKWRNKSSLAHQAYIESVGGPPPVTPNQIRNLLHARVSPNALQEWPRTKKEGLLSTATEYLERVAAEVPEIAAVVEIKKYEKRLGTFGDELAKRAGTDGRLRASFAVAAAKSGRMSCSGPNLQQLPKDKQTRNCLVAANAYVLVVADYTMMEVRAFAEETNDLLLRHDLGQGIDLHRQIAALMNGIPPEQVTPEQRDGAKAIVFGAIYGAGPVTLAAAAWANYGVKLTSKEAATARDRFFARYSTGARWMHVHADLCNHRGYIEIGNGGRVVMAEWETAPGSKADNDSDASDDLPLDPDADDGEDEEWLAIGHNSSHRQYRELPRLKYTLCCNAPIQGGCADAMMVAIALADLLFRTNNIDGGLVLQLHDELVAEVRADQAELAKALIEQAMTAAFLKVFPDAPVNGLLKVKIVKKWGEAKG